MRGVTIAPARRYEAARLARILAEHQAESPWLPRLRSGAQERALLAGLIKKGWVRVARRRGRVLGFLVMGEGALHGLYLTRSARGRGIARALIEEAQSRAPEITLWAHMANTRARRFYMAAGFRPMGFSDGNDEGLPEIRFEWRAAA